MVEAESKNKFELLASKKTELLISLGIVAHNESAHISGMLSSLFEQSLFKQNIYNLCVELIVLPNGCTDDTAEVASQTLSGLSDALACPNFSWTVQEIEMAGKSNAWNLFVHEFSSRDAEYLFLMDSDIQLLESETLASMLNTLFQQPQARVAVDRPIKDVFLKANKTIRDRLSVAISGLSGGKADEGGPAWICGQLYCAEAQALRQICLPTALPGEDAFLYTMIVTDNLQVAQNPHRVVLAGRASHRFEAYTSISQLLRHERWLILISGVNELLFSSLIESGKSGNQLGAYIMENNCQNPGWLSELVRAATVRQWWLIPRFILVRRFVSLMNKPAYKAIALFPLAVAAFGVDLVLSVQANRNLHRGIGLKHWDKTSV